MILENGKSMRLHTPITVVVWGRYRGGIDGEAKKVEKKDDYMNYMVLWFNKEKTPKNFSEIMGAIPINTNNHCSVKIAPMKQLVNYHIVKQIIP